MRKYMIALAILSATSAPVLAQNATPTTPQGVAQPTAKPQTVKKRVCYQEEEDSYSRLGGRKVCKRVEVPAPDTGNPALVNQSDPASQVLVPDDQDAYLAPVERHVRRKRSGP